VVGIESADLAKDIGGAQMTVERAFDLHRDSLFRWAMRHCHNVDVADDLVAATFASAVRRWHTFDPEKSSALTWLGHICQRKYLDHIKTAWHRKVISYDALRVVPFADAADIDRLILVDQTLERIRCVMGSDMLCLIERNQDGEYWDAIAADVGVHPMALKSQVFRAKEAVRMDRYMAR
jgi:DNA-directed RNA polymerase specialized sigma24 family protein